MHATQHTHSMQHKDSAHCPVPGFPPADLSKYSHASFSGQHPGQALDRLPANLYSAMPNNLALLAAVQVNDRQRNDR